MIEVRRKDWIFVAVAAPLAFVWCYCHFFRVPTAQGRDALVAERAQVPDPDMFPLEKRALEKRVKESEAALAEMKAEMAPEALVTGDPTASAADRQNLVLQMFADAELRLVSSGLVEEQAAANPEKGSRGRAVLEATGVRPHPEGRRFVLEGDYAAFTLVLEKFALRKLAVVPESVALTTGGAFCHWEVTIWL